MTAASGERLYRNEYTDSTDEISIIFNKHQIFSNGKISPPTPADDLLLDYCWDHANDDYRPEIILARKTVLNH